MPRKSSITLAKTPRKRAPIERAVFVDFPREGDSVPLGHYAIRVGAPADGTVEVTLDGKAWNVCRNAVGYYWYDWRPEKAGRAAIVARFKGPAGKGQRSLPRHCIVVE